MFILRRLLSYQDKEAEKKRELNKVLMKRIFTLFFLRTCVFLTLSHLRFFIGS